MKEALMTPERGREGVQDERGFWPRVLLFGRILWKRIQEDQNFPQSAALSYNTLFSLLPTLVLALLVMSIISGSSHHKKKMPGAARGRTETAEVSNAANQAAALSVPAPAVEARAPATSATTKAAATTPADNGDWSMEDLEQAWEDKTQQPKAEDDSIGGQAQQWILSQLGLDQIKIEVTQEGKPRDLNLSELLSDRIEKVRELVQSPGTGMIAFAVLLWGALSLMLVVERVFNVIYHAPKARPWLRRFMLYTCLFVWGPIGVAGSIVISQLFRRAGGGILADGSWFFLPLSMLAALFVSWAMLLILYKLIPETRVNWKSAAIGALVGAVLWEVGKYGFGIYVRFSVGTRNWYGGIALVPLFMLWIYLTWNFVLLGLQISYIHQYFDALRRQAHVAMRFMVPLADLRWVLSLGVLLYRRFKIGRPLEPEEAAEELGMPADIATHMLQSLEKTGVVHCVEGKHAYSLSRPPEQVTGGQLLMAARTLCHVAGKGESMDGSKAVRELEAVEQQWADSRNLRQLAGE